MFKLKKLKLTSSMFYISMPKIHSFLLIILKPIMPVFPKHLKFEISSAVFVIFLK